MLISVVVCASTVLFVELVLLRERVERAGLSDSPGQRAFLLSCILGNVAVAFGIIGVLGILLAYAPRE